MRRAAAVLAALAALAAAAPAQGFTRAELGLMETVASAYWPNSPCHGREQVHYVWLGSDTWGLTGWDGAGECDAAVNVFAWGIRDSYAETCLTLAHEFGHLAGRPHAASGIMAEFPTMSGACRIYAGN